MATKADSRASTDLDSPGRAAAGRASSRADAKHVNPEHVNAEHVNDVHVVGRLVVAPERRELPSGDEVVVWRLVVERAGPPATGRPHLDTLDCAAWAARLRRQASSWSPGDIVEVRGALRRRFWRSGRALNSRYEIEAIQLKRLRRVSSGS
jgi:single-strand DNA-binding protein